MALVDSTKVDYLWKKLGYGLTKTAPPANKEAFNESIPSPLLMRGDKVWQNSGSITSVIPASNTSIITVYSDELGSTVETTEDLTAPDNRTWKTGLTDWIPTEFGSTYLVKVYVDTAGASNPQSTGTQLFQSGSGDNDEWFFDYQSGVLNFNGTNIPSQIDTGVTGKSIYIVGARYTGPFGVGSSNAVGNLTIVDTTIGTVTSGDDIILNPTGDGTVTIDTATGLVLPTGNTAQRSSTGNVAGTIRYNTETSQLEIYDGSSWTGVTSDYSITSQVITPDGLANTFSLNESTTANGILVAINGVSQVPDTNYTVSGNLLTMNETPLTTDILDIRYITAAGSTGTVTAGSANSLAYYATSGSVASPTANLAWDGNGLTVTSAFVQVGSLTTTERNALTAANGMVIYNSTDNKFQGYENGSWVNLV